MLELLGGIVAAWMLADFVAGVIHWAEDRYARPEWPILGDWVAKPNILHHSDPQAFLVGGYWYRNSTTLAPAALAIVVAWSCGAPWLDAVDFWGRVERVLAFVFRIQPRGKA